MRARPLETALATCAVLAATAPTTTLVRGLSWTGPVVLVLVLVGLTGLVLRQLRVPAWAVVAAQGVVVVLGCSVLLGLGTGPLGLPGADFLPRVVGRLQEAIRSIRGYAAPAPPTPGIVLLVTSLAGLVAILVDHLAVGRRSAALAGLPLLLVYLVAVVNTAGALPWGYFAVLASLWLLLVVQQHGAGMRRWSTLSPALERAARTRSSDQIVGRFMSLGMLLCGVAVAAALAVQLALPAVPTRFLTDGLARQQRAGGGNLSFTSDVDITRSLTSRDPRPVLTYRTTGDTDPPPLGVAVATDYVGGHWRVTSPAAPAGDAIPAGGVTLPLPPGINPRLPHRVATARVSGTTAMKAPQLAVPGPLVGLDAEVPWRRDEASGMVSVRRPASSYTAHYAVPTVTAKQLAQASSELPEWEEKVLDDPGPLAVDPVSEHVVTRATTEALRQAGATYGTEGTPYATAMAVQQYLRSPGFTYSLELAPLTAAERHNGTPADGVGHFLTTKVGYCTQFSTAMVMMVRSQGVPARVAFGFLPGTQQADGSRVVRAADAHAWPEVFITGHGWMRFEPTPGGRSGLPPAYAQAQQHVAQPTAGPTLARPTPRPTPTRAEASTTAAPSQGSALLSWFTPRRLGMLGALVLLALLLSAVPLRAALVRRRRLARARTRAEAVEAHWKSLAEQLADLGLPAPVGLTPRGLERHYADQPLVAEEGRRAIGRILRAVERARYAPPGASASPSRVEADARTARHAVARSRTWRERLRAALLPRAGLGR